MGPLVRTWLLTSVGLLTMFAVGESIVGSRSWPYYLYDVLTAILGGWAASFGRQAFQRGFNGDGRGRTDRQPQKADKDHARSLH
jgi:hypothetical protein